MKLIHDLLQKKDDGIDVSLNLAGTSIKQGAVSANCKVILEYLIHVHVENIVFLAF